MGLLCVRPVAHHRALALPHRPKGVLRFGRASAISFVITPTRCHVVFVSCVFNFIKIIGDNVSTRKERKKKSCVYLVERDTIQRVLYLYIFAAPFFLPTPGSSMCTCFNCFNVHLWPPLIPYNINWYEWMPAENSPPADPPPASRPLASTLKKG